MSNVQLRSAREQSDWDLDPVAEVWVDASAEPSTVIGSGELSAEVVPSLLTTVRSVMRKGCAALTVDLRGMTATDTKALQDLRRALAALDERTRIVVLAGDL